ncbi:MAG: hypothetical protein PF692_00765 [Kiritimatiellae bacterium]|jgi:hypothetical protein|nr:hypothetical protein [Kiritimatiellia bacterium]
MAAPYTKPIAIFALMQVSIIVLGILAAGIASKMARDLGAATTGTIIFIRNHGIYLLFIPIIWGAVTAYVQNTSSGIKSAILLYSGLAIAIILALFMFFKIAAPMPIWGGQM